LRGRRIPFVPQMEKADCGAACLAMVLGYHGKEVSRGELREATGTTSRDGVVALAILEAARRYGLRGRGITLKNVEDLEYLEPGSILHFGMVHFVVFSRFTKRFIEVVDPDPAVGRRRVPMEEFRKMFTGVVLEFEPSESFEPERRQAKRVRHYLRQIFGYWRELSRVVVTSVLVQLLALALPLLTSVLVDRVVPRGDHDLLMVLGVGLLAIILFNFLTSFVRAHLLLHLRTYIDTQLTLSFLEHLVNLSLIHI